MYDGDEEKSKILRTELVHGSENVVDFLVEFMHKAKLRIDVCVDHTRPGLCIEISEEEYAAPSTLHEKDTIIGFCVYSNSKLSVEYFFQIDI